MNIIELHYSNIIKQLESGLRPRIKFSHDEWENFIFTLPTYKKEGFILLHFLIPPLEKTISLKLAQILITELVHYKENPKSADYYIPEILQAIDRQVISESFRTGNLPPSEYFNQLKILLSEKNLVLVEWALRYTLNLDGLSLRLKNEIMKTRPNLFSCIAHPKTSKLINEHLKRYKQDYLKNEKIKK